MARRPSPGSTPVAALTAAALLVLSGANAALGADAENGRRLAQANCTQCHIVAPGQRNEVAAAPPFDAIARKYGGNHDLILAALLGPHPKMNFSPTQPQADDIAAYIATLGR